jgi:hypothetical protein
MRKSLVARPALALSPRIQAVARRTSPRPLDRRDVDLAHLHHRLAENSS